MSMHPLTEAVFDQMKKPIGAMPDMDEWEKAAKSWFSAMPGDIQSAGNLMGPAMATAAAMSAVGVAAAAQSVGLFMGAMNGMMEASKAMKVVPQDISGMMFGWSTFDSAGEKAEPAKAKAKVEAVKPVKKPVAEAKAPLKGPVEEPRTERIAQPVVEPASAAFMAAETVAEDFAKTVSDAIDITGKALTGMASDMDDMTKKASAATAEAITSVMPEDFVKPFGIEKPGSPDDLKLISGVGPKLEQVLNGLGIWTFDQVSKWTAAEIAWVDDYLQFSGRIGRDNWLGQAAALAKGGIEEYAKVFGKQPK